MIQLLLALAAARAPAQTAARPSVHVTVTTRPIRIDGRLDDAAWAAVTPVTGFFQLDPDEGRPASEVTEVRILLGADALYVGARMLDRSIGSLQHRLARRDDAAAADGFSIELDPLHDRLHGYRFQVGPDGTVSDAVISSTGEVDLSWDPVWEARTSIDSLGWTAEMKIPLSQLRFNRGGDVWGVQLERFLLRRLERSYFAFAAKSSLAGRPMNPGYYGELTGVGGLQSPHRIEVMPYVSGAASYRHEPAAGPVLGDAGGRYTPRVGADARVGISSDLTLNASLNPDFGQVEVDPAVVNLTAFETQFPEKRPFFVEAADRFRFGDLRAWEQASRPVVFYSRRIGRAPQLDPFGDPTVAFADVPERTDILGAVKMIGRSQGGWTVGMLDALTRSERAPTISLSGQRGSAEVEPLANYFVGRLARDLREGQTTIGGLMTGVNRRLDGPALDARLASSAYVGGLELAHSWGHRSWAIDANYARSLVSGSPAAIERLQRSSARYFQRPDSRHDHLDPARTRLAGSDAEMAVTRLTGNWVGSVTYQDVSPGYETNDAGLLHDAGRRNVSLDLHYQRFKPGKLFRNFIIWPFTDHTWNYDGQMVLNKFNFYFQSELLNRWRTGVEYDFLAPVTDDRLTRGGPLTRAPSAHIFYYSLTSPARGRLALMSTARAYYSRAGVRSITMVSGLTLQARSNLKVSLNPTIALQRDPAQYVGSYADPTASQTFGSRTIVARLNQRTVGLETRVDWVLARGLTLQMYSQALIGSNEFTRYSALRRPGAYAFAAYGSELGTISTDASGAVTVDADGAGPAPAYTTPRPDFTIRSLRTNGVLRWEFRPGSTVFLVWQQQRGLASTAGDFRLGRDLHGLLSGPADNVLAVKATWWLAW